MRLIDLDNDKEAELAVPVKGAKEKRAFDVEKAKQDPNGLVDITEGSNFAKLAMTLKTFNFADNTTMHGMRYVFMRDISRIRRLVWILIVLGGMGYWYYIVSQTIQSYYEYPTVTKIKTVFEKKSEMPAVTICNLNLLQKSKMTTEEEQIIGHVFGQRPLPSNVSLNDYDHVDVKQFFRDKGASYTTQFCIHKSLPCNSKLVNVYLTDYGICFTFDPGEDESAKYQTYPGNGGGLYTAGFFSHDEWTFGPYYFEEGFRVLLHPSGTTPLTLSSKGIPLVPTFISEIAITRHESTFLPPPHGDCGSKKLQFFKKYSREKCLLECRTEHTLSICGCRMYYMPGNSNFCTFHQTKACQTVTIFPPNDTYLFDAAKCGCPQDCSSVRFEYRLAQSKPSVGYGELVEQVYNIKLKEAVALRVFYQELAFSEDIEEPIYTTEKLLCDVGGAAGLFLGCSFITIMEFLDFVLEFGWFWIARAVLWKSKKSSTVNVGSFN